MTISHKNIDDPEIHEPKGISTATTKSVYIADGAGSGSWEVITDPTDLTENSTTIGGTNDGNIPDISTISVTYTQAEVIAVRDAVREIADKLNTLMSNMRTAGLL